MPQLDDMRAVVDGGDGADLVGVEVVAVRFAHQVCDLVVGDVDVEGAVDGCRALGVGQIGKREDLLERHRGDFLGDENAASRGKAAHHGGGERNGLAAFAARVDVAVLAERAGAVDMVRHGLSFL